MNDLLKLAIDGHGGMHRWEQLLRFRAAVSVTGAISVLKGRPAAKLARAGRHPHRC